MKSAPMDPSDQELMAFWHRSVRTAVAVVLAGAALLWASFPVAGPALARGLLLGGATSLLRFQLSFRAMRRSPDAARLVRVRLLTYVLSGAALALAFWRRERISPWSAGAGLLAMNGAIVLTELLSGRERGQGTRSAPRPGTTERDD